MVEMKDSQYPLLVNYLKGNCVFVDLGSAGAEGFKAPLGGLAKAVTFVELDAASLSSLGSAEFFQMHKIGKGVAGAPGKRLFYHRKFPPCSSLLKPNIDLIQEYGLEDYFVELGRTEMECTTLNEILEDLKINRVDFLKTDLEGLDFEVISSSEGIVKSSLVIQCEARFLPIFEGEPPFFEIAKHLEARGFDLITIHPEVWKYNTAHRLQQRDGRLVMADAIFFLRPDHVRKLFGSDWSKAMVKQAIIAKANRMHNFAERLFEMVQGSLDVQLQKELAGFINSVNGEQSALQGLVTMMLPHPLLARLVRRANRGFSKLYKATRVL